MCPPDLKQREYKQLAYINLIVYTLAGLLGCLIGLFLFKNNDDLLRLGKKEFFFLLHN